MDGRILVAAALGATLLARHRRGSRQDGAVVRHQPLSEIQTRMLQVKNQYKTKPELAIRALDVIISQIPGAGEIRDVALPGTHFDVETMLDGIRTPANPNATISDYLDELARQIREDQHYAAGRAHPFTLRVGWDRARYIPWMAREVVRTVEAARSTRTTTGRPRKTTTAEKTHKVMVDALVAMRKGLAEVLDWIVSTHADVSGLTYAQAAAASQAWHEQLQAVAQAQRRRIAQLTQDERAAEQAARNLAERHGDHRSHLPGPVLYQFQNGWTVQKLTTKAQLVEEGGLLHHCVGLGSYDENMRSGQMVSLRDPENRPWQTLSMSRDGAALENAQGRYDRDLGHREGHFGSGGRPHYVDEVDHEFPEGMKVPDLLEFECYLMREFLEHVGGGTARWGRHRDCEAKAAAWADKLAKAQKKKGSTGRRRPRAGSRRTTERRLRAGSRRATERRPWAG